MAGTVDGAADDAADGMAKRLAKRVGEDDARGATFHRGEQYRSLASGTWDRSGCWFRVRRDEVDRLLHCGAPSGGHPGTGAIRSSLPDVPLP